MKLFLAKLWLVFIAGALLSTLIHACVHDAEVLQWTLLSIIIGTTVLAGVVVTKDGEAE